MQVSVPGLFGLPGNVVSASLGLANDPSQAAMLMADAPTGKFVSAADPRCLQTCARASAPAADNTATAG